jgi:hypothetical protein
MRKDFGCYADRIPVAPDFELRAMLAHTCSEADRAAIEEELRRRGR